MSEAYDIVVESSRRHRVLIVECKWAKETSLENAIAQRRLLASYRDFEAPFFMLAFRTALYLWKQGAELDAAPDFSSPAKQVLRDYLGRLADQPDILRSQSLELAILSWLGDLASGVREPDPASEADQMLIRSGVYAQMRNGRVWSEAYA